MALFVGSFPIFFPLKKELQKHSNSIMTTSVKTPRLKNPKPLPATRRHTKWMFVGLQLS